MYLITFSYTLLLLSLLSDRQVKMINILSRFIDYHLQSIVSIIRARHVLTLHLSTANWRKLTGSCCKNASAHYVILPDRVMPQFLELWSTFNAFWWNTNFTLLYRNATTYGINDMNCHTRYFVRKTFAYLYDFWQKSSCTPKKFRSNTHFCRIFGPFGCIVSIGWW